MDDRLKEKRSFVADEAERNAADLRAGIARLKESFRDYRSRRRRDDGDDHDGQDGHP